MSDRELFEDEAAIGEFKTLMSDPASRQAFVELKAQAAESGARTRYAHVMRAVSETPWAIRLPMLGIIVDLLAYRVAGGRLSSEEIEARIGAARRPTNASPQGVAVIPIHGVIMPKASMMSEMSGGTSVEKLRAEFRQAMAAPDISGIVFDVDSPGGMVDGVPEMAAEIRSARGTKPITAVANTEAASAAYWLAAQADRLYVSKSGRVGSIGVYTSHGDESAKADMEGIKTTLVAAGKFKTEGNPFEPLTDEARASLQSMVDDYYAMFVSDVSRGRKIALDEVRQGYGQGRIVQARPALDEGMVDGIATLDEVVADMLEGLRRQAAVAALDQARQLAASATEADMIESINASMYGESWGSATNANTVSTNMSTTSTITVAEPAVTTYISAEDTSTWDGDRAMSECESASDYRSICAGERTVGEVGERQHWALPHHYLNKGPNGAGVRNALARLPQTQDLAERELAQAHLDGHMREITPDADAAAREAVGLYLSDIDPDGELLRVREEAPKPMGDVDQSEWITERALNQCVTEDDFRSVCAGERPTGKLDEREHWVLAHHYLGKPASIEGVRNALSRLPHIENIVDREDAERHLNFHLREISPSGNGLSADADVLAELQRVKSPAD